MMVKVQGSWACVIAWSVFNFIYFMFKEKKRKKQYIKSSFFSFVNEKFTYFHIMGGLLRRVRDYDVK